MEVIWTSPWKSFGSDLGVVVIAHRRVNVKRKGNSVAVRFALLWFADPPEDAPMDAYAMSAVLRDQLVELWAAILGRDDQPR